MAYENKNRIFGLDLLRTLAITLVVFVHYINTLPIDIGFLPNIRLPDGVDLFFVLSGYLIGAIVIRTFEEKKDFNLVISLNFLLRRWFRTLPNYFLFLIVNVVLIYYSLIPGEINKYIVTYLFFFQNFHKPYDFMFWESWSLAVEEWFYLIFPFIIVVLTKLKNSTSAEQRKKTIFQTIVVLITLPLLYRVFQSAPTLNTDLYFRKLVLTRLDTIAFGILSAYINFYYIQFWNKYKTLLFTSGVGLLTGLLSIKIESTFFNQTFYFTLMSLSIAMLLPKFSTWNNGNILTKPITFISKISYSIYLIHLPILYIVNAKLNLDKGSFEFLLVYLLFIVVTSAIIYRFYEHPLTMLREKIKVVIKK